MQKNTEDPDYYDIGVTIKDGVKNFGPVFPPKIHKSLIRQFLLVKSKILLLFPLIIESVNLFFSSVEW